MGRSRGADGRGQITWCGWKRAGHVVRMEEGRLPKKAEAMKQTGHVERMEEGRSRGVYGRGPTTKESRGDETARPSKKGKNATEVGGPGKAECKKAKRQVQEEDYLQAEVDRSNN